MALEVSTIEVILTTGSKLEPHTLIDSYTWTTCIAFFLTFFGITAILLYGMIIKFILKKPLPRRPIDVMNLVDQSIQGVSFTVLFTIFASVLWTHRSIEDIYGSIGCWFLFFSTPIFMWSRLVGGLGISTFRYLFMNCPQNVQKYGVKKIVNYIWALEAFILTLTTVIVILASLVFEQGLLRMTTLFWWKW